MCPVCYNYRISVCVHVLELRVWRSTLSKLYTEILIYSTSVVYIHARNSYTHVPLRVLLDGKCFCGDIVISILQHRVKIAETGEVIEVSDEDIEKVSTICVLFRSG